MPAAYLINNLQINVFGPPLKSLYEVWGGEFIVRSYRSSRLSGGCFDCELFLMSLSYTQIPFNSIMSVSHRYPEERKKSQHLNILYLLKNRLNAFSSVKVRPCWRVRARRCLHLRPLTRRRNEM